MGIGFSIDKRPGHGAGRACFVDRFADKKMRSSLSPRSRSPALLAKNSRLAVIGAGIAGCLIARILTDRGYNVTVFDPEKGFAAGASYTPSAVMYPGPAWRGDVGGQLNVLAFYRAVGVYDGLAKDGCKVWQRWGLLVAGPDRADAKRYQNSVNSDVFASNEAQWYHAYKASAQCGLDLFIGRTWFPMAGALRTREVRKALLEDITLCTNQFIADFVM